MGKKRKTKNTDDCTESNFESDVLKLEKEIKDTKAEVVKVLDAKAKSDRELQEFRTELKKIYCCGLCGKQPRYWKEMRGICNNCYEHYVCFDCPSRNCQRVRRRFDQRNFLENQFQVIRSQLSYDCCYSTAGCSTSEKLALLEKHEAECDFKSITCINSDCKATLCLKALENHFNTQHYQLRCLNAIKIDSQQFHGGKWDYVCKWKLDPSVLIILVWDAMKKTESNRYCLMVNNAEKCSNAKAEIDFVGDADIAKFPLKICSVGNIDLEKATQKGRVLEINRNYIESMVGTVKHVLISMNMGQ